MRLALFGGLSLVMHPAEWIPPYLRQWLTPAVAVGLSLLSLLLVAISAVLGILFARWIPEDYFLKPPAQRTRRGLPSFLWLLVRQGLGLLLLLAGLLMLVLPGQGLLTLLAALCVAEYPGKRGLVARIVRRRTVQRALNALRRRAGQRPLRFPAVHQSRHR